MALEGSIIPIVEDMFKEGLAHHRMAPGEDASLPATTAAWAVFGAARRWFQSPNRVPAEEMAARRNHGEPDSFRRLTIAEWRTPVAGGIIV
jgi:hypothetical protein